MTICFDPLSFEKLTMLSMKPKNMVVEMWFLARTERRMACVALIQWIGWKRVS